MEARVIFSQETREKMEKGLNQRERGELRFRRLKELEESGELSKATSRVHIAQMMGFQGKPYGTGYNWISNLIRQKYLSETMTGVGPSGKIEFEYHIIGNPEYSMVGRRNIAKKVKPEVKVNELSAIKAVEDVTTGKIPKVIIRYSGLSIELEQVDYAFIKQVVTALADKKGV